MKVFRYQIPVDDQWHNFELTGPIVHVACRPAIAAWTPGPYDQLSNVNHWVHFWALDTFRGPHAIPPYTATLRIYGTGHDIPDDATYRGTAINEPLVWHLFEKPQP